MLALELKSGDIFQLEFSYYSKDEHKCNTKFDAGTRYLFLSREPCVGDRFLGIYLDGSSIKSGIFQNILPVTKVVG